MALAISGVLFAIFTANVAFGALRWPVFLSDVAEMIVLLAAVSAFVVAILQREKSAREHQE